MAWAGSAGLPGTRREPIHGGSMAPTVPGSPVDPTLPAFPRRRGEQSQGQRPGPEPFAAQRDPPPTRRSRKQKRQPSAAFLLLLLPLIPPFPSAPAGNLTGGPSGPLQDRSAPGCGGRAPWERVLCLRSTASQVPERPAAEPPPGGGSRRVPQSPPPITHQSRRRERNARSPYSASIAVSFSRAGPASFGLSNAKRIVASTRPRCVPQSKRVPSKR